MRYATSTLVRMSSVVVPIVAANASALSSAVQALTAGAYRYAAKPLALSDLKLLVEDAIGTPAA